MQVAKYWRNKKLRYRLMRTTQRSETERVVPRVKPAESVSRVKHDSGRLAEVTS